VSDAGYQLIFALRECERAKPSAFSYVCLRGSGISEKSLACLKTLPKAAKKRADVLLACGILATVPIDAAERCKDIADRCLVAALSDHKSAVAICQK
jgi:hypothetical protein